MPAKHPRSRYFTPTHQRGVAMMLVLIAVALAAVFSLPFLEGQSTSSGISENAQNHARARTIAESALTIAIDHIQNNPDWRSTFPNGQWVSNQSFDGGLMTIIGEDPDGDFSDRINDELRLTGIGDFGGVTHRVSALIKPRPTGASGVCLFIIQNRTGPNAIEQNYIDLIELWGYQVIIIDDDAQQSAFDAAAQRATVVYIHHDINASVADRITDTAIGIVTEHGDTYPVLGFSASDATYTGTAVDITHATHPLTAHLGAGVTTLFQSPHLLKALSGTIGAGVTTLAQRENGTGVTFAALHIGAARYGGGTAPARRVMLPWGDAPFDPDALGDDGLALMRRAIDWAAVGLPENPAAALTEWQSGLGYNSADGENRLLVFVATTEGHHTITSVKYGGQTLTHVADDSIYTPNNWGKAFMFTLDDQGIVAADGGGFDVEHTGTSTAWKFASRMYQHVNQSNSIRATGGQTQGETPNTITSGLIGAEPGDLAVAVVHSGNTTSYTWGFSFVKGVDVGSHSFTLSAADRIVIDPPGSIQSQATAGLANRQVLITAVLAAAPAQNDADDDADIPQLISLWEFNEVPIPEPNRLGHWRLDDIVGGNSILGVAAQEEIVLRDHSLIDSYDSSVAPYGNENMKRNAYVGTNYNAGTRIYVSRSEIRGHAYCGINGNPTSVIKTTAGGTITGIRAALLDEMQIFPSISEPPGMPASERSKNFRINQIWSSDHKYRDLVVDGCDITVDGDVRVYATEKIEFKNGARLIIPPGSSLSLYANRDIIFDDGSLINYDTQGADRLHVFMRDDEEELIIKNNAKVCGILYSRNDLEVSFGGELWGAVQVYDDIELWTHAAIHMDSALGGTGSGAGTATEAVNGNVGTYHNGPNGNKPGQRGHAVHFDGINDYLEIPHADSYLISEGSISLWFYAETITGTQGLFTKTTLGLQDYGQLELLLHNGQIQFGLQSQTGTNVITSDSIEANQWHHITATFGIRGMELFVNGASATTGPYTGGLTAHNEAANNLDPIIIGASGGLLNLGLIAPIKNPFKGLIDDVQIFDQALDLMQVENVMAGGDPGPSNLPGPIVMDTSGNGEPANLIIDNLENITWLEGGGLGFTGPSVARSPSAIPKLYNALTLTNELTFEVIFTPYNITYGNTSRIVAYSDGDAACNFTFGQYSQQYVTRLRTSDTFSDGSPKIESADILEALARQHVLVSYDGTNVKVFRNGSLESTHPRTGVFTWNSAMPFAVGNEADGSAPWQGELRRVAIYDRAIDITQATRIFNGFPPGPPGNENGNYSYAIRWLEAE